MTDFAKCKDAACDPVFQVRGEMGPGDYFGVLNADGDLDLDHHKGIEIHDDNRHDCRIACRACALQTPWSPNPQNMPGAGLHHVSQNIWAKMVADKQERHAIFAAMIEQFGEDAVKKHLRHSMTTPRKVL